MGGNREEEAMLFLKGRGHEMMDVNLNKKIFVRHQENSFHSKAGLNTRAGCQEAAASPSLQTLKM